MNTTQATKEKLQYLASITKDNPVFKQDYKEKESEQTIVKTTNKNAYEIRLAVLENAIKWSSLANNGLYYKPSDTALLELARKFYMFVENK